MDLQQSQLANRLARVYKHRRKWAKRLDISCFRLYEKDIADQPMIIDWYDGDVLIWAFHRTRNETPADEQAWLEAATEAACHGLGVAAGHVVIKTRRPQKDRQGGAQGDGQEGQYQRVDHRHLVKQVREQGLTFEVNLSDYLDTGLFLDHRVTRDRVRAASRDLRVLNLFAYTGSFTCYACAGGARSTLTIDLSNTYLEWAARNLALNGIAPGGAHRLLRADCLAWLASPTPERFDLIICDPPTFSNSTSMAHDFAVGRDHVWMLARLRERLAPQGVVYFSTNFRDFELDPALAGWRVEETSASSVPEDFRDRRIHRSWQLRPLPL